MQNYSKFRAVICLIIFSASFFQYEGSVFAKQDFIQPPQLISPVKGEITGTSPLFTWSDLRGVNSYLIQVSVQEDVNFNNPVIEEYVSGSQYQSAVYLDQGGYIWRVRANKKRMSGEWSSQGNFVVNTESGVFFDDFSDYQTGQCLPEGTYFGPWLAVFDGYGCTEIETDGINYWLHISPDISRSPSETHSSLVTGPYFEVPFYFDVLTTTVKQLRTENPYPWEVGWVVWNYYDNEHFYYFIPKPNGWELGKRDPEYPGGQRFLATGTEPQFPIGNEYEVTIEQDLSNIIRVYVDGNLITSFQDDQSPYTSGLIGLYSEDAHVHFDNVNVTQ